MNKMDKWITKFIVYATPLVVIILGWAAWQLWNDPQGAESLHGKSFAFMALAVCFLVWIVSLFYIVVKMVLVQRLRDEILGGIAGMKERDERESAIVGEAAKVSFLSTMAFMILLLMLSVVQVEVSKSQSAEDSKPQTTGVIKLNFDLLQKKSPDEQSDSDDLEEQRISEVRYFVYPGLPLSNMSLLLMIFLWQVISFKYVMRQETGDSDY